MTDAVVDDAVLDPTAATEPSDREIGNRKISKALPARNPSGAMAGEPP